MFYGWSTKVLLHNNSSMRRLYVLLRWNVLIILLLVSLLLGFLHSKSLLAFLVSILSALTVMILIRVHWVLLLIHYPNVWESNLGYLLSHRKNLLFKCVWLRVLLLVLCLKNLVLLKTLILIVSMILLFYFFLFLSFNFRSNIFIKLVILHLLFDEPLGILGLWLVVILLLIYFR